MFIPGQLSPLRLDAPIELNKFTLSPQQDVSGYYYLQHKKSKITSILQGNVNTRNASVGVVSVAHEQSNGGATQVIARPSF
jgi:hypothetical protein